MFIVLGFFFFCFLVFLARILYLFFFEKHCEIQQCLMQIDDIQKLMYLGIILIGTYNAYLMSKSRKYAVLVFEFIGTFIFAFALNFVELAQ